MRGDASVASIGAASPAGMNMALGLSVSIADLTKVKSLAKNAKKEV